MWEALSLNSTWMLSRSCFELIFWINKLKTIDREAVSWNYLFKIVKVILQSNSHNTIWFVDPSTEVKSAQHMVKLNTNRGLISNFSLVQKRKMYETSMKHLKIHKFPFKNVIYLAIGCKMYLKIQQKLRCLNCILKKPCDPPWRKQGWIP